MYLSTFKRHITLNLVYLVVFIINILAQVTSNEVIKIIAMPLIGMSLTFYLLIKTKLKGRFNQLIFIGLVLAMAGDIQLLFTDDEQFFFMSAVVATFISYIVYNLAFCMDIKSNTNTDKKYGFITLALVLIISGYYYLLLKPYLGEYELLLIIHCLILSLLPVFAALRYNSVNLTSFILVLAGCICFMVSDYCIAYSNFVQYTNSLMIIYIIAYMLAQYLLVIGTIERKLTGSYK